MEKRYKLIKSYPGNRLLVGTIVEYGNYGLSHFCYQVKTALEWAIGDSDEKPMDD